MNILIEHYSMTNTYVVVDVVSFLNQKIKLYNIILCVQTY